MPSLRVFISIVLLVGFTASLPALAQADPHPSTQLLGRISPPVDLPGPGAQPNALQQFEIQNYRNQLEERQLTEQFMTGPQAAERQMRTQQRLDQLDLMRSH